ncbi:MAG: VWA domain-containing protein [Candidatus Brocadiaceae bacterium]|nr:VWA domain-containing protein [Candidatus Brocadiaceae bacterium]
MPVENENMDRLEENGKKKKFKYIVIPLILLLTVVVIMMLRRNVSPILEISPIGLDFGSKETEMEFIIKNTGTAGGFFRPGVTPLKFTIETRYLPSWLSVQPASGIIEDDPQQITVSVDRRFLPPESSIEEVRVLTNAGDSIVRILAQKEKDKIIVTSPTPNSSLSIGDKLPIEWTATSGVSSFVTISTYLNGENIGTIAHNYNYRKDTTSKGSFTWNVGNFVREGSGYSIRIEDAGNSEIFDEVGPIKIFQPLSAIKVLNQTEDHQIPSTVQFIFSLRDQNNHAILFDSDQVDWKNIKIWENGNEIDYLESHALLYTQDDFQLQVMLVLDFSASMYETNEDINKMLSSVRDLIDSLNETHQIGVVEFHRPDEPPAILQTFTTYKNAAKEAIDNFSSSKIYRDFSSCWDAVQKGLQQFPEQPDPNIFKTLVFLSDGFDNSSFNTPDTIIASAKDRDVHIFVVGIGDIREENVLKNIAFETGGTYVHSENLNLLQERFKQSINDIKGQYKIKYISPKKPEDGHFTVASETTYKGVTGTPLLQGEIDSSSIFGKTIEGVIRFSAPSVIKYNKVEIFMWCEHAPRYIHEFHFWIGSDKPHQVTLTSLNDGGLCQDWTLQELEDGWYRLTSPNQDDPRQDLEFGDFGTLCKIVFTDINEEGFVIPFKLDNSIYDMGQAFYGEEGKSQTETWSANIRVGNAVK